MKKIIYLAFTVAISLLSIAASAQGKWNIVRKTNEMTGIANVRACVISTNSIRQGFPYNGGSTSARLCIYKDADGVESSMAINQGQLMCDLDKTTFLLKIDDDDPDDMNCVGTSSGNSEMGYFSDGKSSVEKIIFSKKNNPNRNNVVQLRQRSVSLPFSRKISA